MGNAIAGIFGVLAIVVVSSWVAAEALSSNPVKGEAIFAEHCARCHGKSGDGLGPEVKELIVPPADLRALKSRSKTDMELLLAIKQGVLFSPMHGWKDRLSEQDMLDVLGYIRSLAPFNPIT